MTTKKRSTRETVLHTIKASPNITVEALAIAADVSPVTVRHHLNALQADGLIESESVRRKVGRPYYVYSLTERGQEQFPKRYVRLTSRLLDELKERLPKREMDSIFVSVVDAILEERRGEFEHLSFEKRMDYLVDLLAEEGFLSTWEETATGYKLVEYSCPYMSIGGEHSEVCTLDSRLIMGVLQLPVRQHSCMLEGDTCCEFSFDLESVSMTNDKPLAVDA